MNMICQEKHRKPGRFMSNFAFWTITLMHDNPLLPFFKNPYKLLDAMGLKSGLKVLEIGCGPGFFTIPAAKIVGERGLVYAVDVNHLAIERVQKKIKKEGIKNVTLLHKNASNTGLPDRSIDLAFIFGTLHFSGGVENVVSEINRILKPGGVLLFGKSRGSEKELCVLVEDKGFKYSDRNGRILLFNRKQD